MEETQQEQISISQQLKTFVFNACAGGVSAAVGKTVSAPMERVKIVLQTAKQNSMISREYKSGIDCFQRILKEEGVLSFWKGNLVNVIRYVPTQALNFAFKERIFQIMNVKQEKNQTKFILKSFFAGGISGTISNTIVYPLDFVRTRLAVDMGKSQADRQFKGIIDCLVKVLKTDGIAGIYRGVFSNGVGIFLYRGGYFGLYDYGKKHESIRQFQNRGLVFKFIWAQLVTIFAASLAYPSDTVKRKMMMQSNSKTLKYKGTLDCIQKISQQEGFVGFYRGYMFNCLRSVSGAVCLVLFDEIQKIQSKGKE